MATSALSPEELDELRVRLEARAQYQSASTEERERIQRRAELEADFPAFVRAAWHVIRPGQELRWSWHYDLIAEWLTLVFQRKCLRLIVNISPRTLKSILVTVMFPAWVWTKQPSHSFACASYSGELSTEHSVMRRNLIESDWFKSLWGDRLWLADDQNQKTKYKNNFEAQMIATSVGGTATGLGGDTLIVDDALKADEAKSDVIRKAALEWFDGTWRTRLNDQATGALVVVEQRTHELDLSGYLKEEGGWTHLCLPLEAEEHERWVFPVSGRVVEREIGAVLQPDRFPPEVVVVLKKLRLVWSGQYQQHPAPLEGNMIKRADVRYYGGRDPITGERDRELPIKFDNILISVDCAFKDLKTSDYVCVGAIGVSGPDRFILNVVLAHLDMPATELETLRQRRVYGARTVLVEDKANGPAVVKALRQRIPGVIEINPEGGKITRMFAACSEWQSGNWYVQRNAGWTEEFVEEITKFPTAKHDDQCFAAGTKVATLLGEKNIEHVTPGEWVVTPFGLGRVTAAGVTGYAETVSWRGLQLTPTHKVFVDGQFSSVDTITQAAIEDRIGICSLTRWMLLKQLSFSVSPTGSWEGRSGITSANLAATQAGGALRACTLLFGSMSTAARFQKGTTFIIRTLIGSITTLAIWSAYRSASIGRIILGHLQHRRLWRTPESSPRSGTSQKRAAHGIASWLRSQRKNWSAFADNAAKDFFPRDQLCTAGITAHGRQGQPAANATSQLTASFAEPVSLQCDSSTQAGIVEPAAMDASGRRPEQSLVYDLQVEGHGCFYANGILVSNCDMMTQAAIYLQQNGQSYGLIEYLKQLEKAAMAKRLGKTGPAPKKVDASVQQANGTNGGLHETKAMVPETTGPEHETDPTAHKTDGTAHTDEKIGVDIPDNVDRCPACSSVLVQRVAGGKRCGQCGHQWAQPGMRMGQVSPGQLRK